MNSNVYSIAQRVARQDSRLRIQRPVDNYFRFHCLLIGVACVSAFIGFLVGAGLAR